MSTTRFSGRRLQRQIQATWGRRGGVRGFCRCTGLKPSTVYAWFRGDSLPELGSIAIAADALSMRCSDVVALLESDERNSHA